MSPYGSQDACQVTTPALNQISLHAKRLVLYNMYASISALYSIT